MSEINTTNAQLVGRQGDHVVVMMPRARMTREEALAHAAWLVLVADSDGSEFAGYLEAVANGD